jgi:hypothetical protein
MQRTNNLFRLGYSILVGPIVWAVHFMTVWVVSEFGCRANFNNVLFYPPATIRTAIIVATVVQTQWYNPLCERRAGNH